MFGSTVIEIVMGLAFLYGLLSLLVSATMEVLSAWLKLRSQNLWLAVANLLGRYDDEQVRTWARELYDDGLLRTLSAPSRTDLLRMFNFFPLRLLWPLPKGPSYIPPEAFATALVQKVKAGSQVQAHRSDAMTVLRTLAGEAGLGEEFAAERLGELNQKLTAALALIGSLKTAVGQLAEPGTAEQARRELHGLLKQVAPQALLPGELEARKVEELKQLVDAVTRSEPYIQRLRTVVSQLEHRLGHQQISVKQARELLATTMRAIEEEELRGLIQDIPLPDLRNSLLTLYDEAAGDIKQFQQNIEQWFNASMDRATAWYKRKSVMIQMLLGIAFAVLLNADTLDVAGELAKNPALREALAAQAAGFALTQQATRQVENASPSQAPGLGDNIFLLTDEINELQLPIGWNTDPPSSGKVASGRFDPRRFPGWLPAAHPERDWGPFLAEWRKLISQQIVGWLVTAIAVSLGAPFWFDVINKFVRLRTGGNMGTVKTDAKA